MPTFVQCKLAIIIRFVVAIGFQQSSLNAMEVSNIYRDKEANARVEAALMRFNITAIDTIRNVHHDQLDYIAYNQKGERIRVACFGENYQSSTRPHISELVGYPETIYKLLVLKYKEQQEKLKNK